MQHQQIEIPGHDRVRSAVDGKLEELVVGRIAAGHDARGDRDKLGAAEQPPYIGGVARRELRRDVGPLQHFERLRFGRRRFQQAAVPVNSAHDAGGP